MALPIGWKRLPLKEVCASKPLVNPRKSPSKEFDYVDIASVSNETFSIGETKRLLGSDAPSRARKPIFADDVIFSTTRPYLKSIAKVPVSLDGQVCSTGFCVLRPSPCVLSDWLFFNAISDDFVRQVTPKMRGGNYPAVSDSDVLEGEIPLPPLEEQQRLIARLKEMIERVDEVRGLCRDVSETKPLVVKMLLRERYDSLCKSKTCVPLEQLVHAFGGGTPSKKRPEYWQGSIPWVSPKDMKVPEIVDATDHISQEGIDNSSTKLIEPPAVLFVVRGMILAHTLPVAVSSVPVTINQDMKALKPRASMSATYLAQMIRGAAGYLLHDVEIAGHGTCRLKTEIWSKLPIPILHRDEEGDFVASISAAERVVDDLRTTTEKEVTAITQAILRKAFAGEL